MNLLIFMDSVKFFSIKRLKSYKNEQEHKKNFLLVQALAPKLGILEIATRNLDFYSIDSILRSFSGCFKLDDFFWAFYGGINMRVNILR